VPNPWQAAQGLEVITWPRNDRATRCTTPCPPQTSQVRGDVPGLQQVPWQVGQTTAVSTATSRWVPKAASDRSISSRTRASWPRRARGTGPRRAEGPAPKNVSKMSWKPKPAPKPPPLGAAGSTPLSYIWRFSGFESTS